MISRKSTYIVTAVAAALLLLAAVMMLVYNIIDPAAAAIIAIAAVAGMFFIVIMLEWRGVGQARSEQRHMRESNERLNLAMRNMTATIWDYDLKTREIIQSGDSIEKHGFESTVSNVPESLIECGYVHPESVEAFRAMYASLFAGAEKAEGIFRMRTADRQGWWYEHIQYVNLFDSRGRPYRAVGMSQDVTDRQELWAASQTDSLTGLLNHNATVERIRQHMAAPRSAGVSALFIIDMDYFKQINDRMGHQTGDETLIRVASIIRDSFRAQDVVGRLGGDEFMAFLDSAPETAVIQKKARQLLQALDIYCGSGEKSVSISASVGAAVCAPGEDFSSLYDRADAALYKAKEKGRNQYKIDLPGGGEPVCSLESDGCAESLKSGLEAGQGRLWDEGVRARRRVLVVDDNEINRRMLCHILSGDYETIQAENGEQAMEIMYKDHESISAVLLDIVMPVMDGYQVLRLLRGDEDLSKVPVIVATGNTDLDAEVTALSLGAHDFIAKPYNPAVIRRRLANIINLRETAAIVNQVEKDELTGLYSKAFFYKKAAALITAGEAGSFDMLCCDIERFKLVNELFGEKTGDALLKHVADTLSSAAGSVGVCGRIGADKFAWLTPHRERYDAVFFESTASRVNRFPVSISIRLRHGIFAIADTSLPVGTICDRALTACNSIKSRYGVWFAYYDDAFMEKLLREQFILDGMRAGISQRQFQVYYQPKFRIATEEMTGAEALVRWIHPVKGFMSPGEFIPLFEKNGFITDLDVYVWDTVCRDLSEWKAQGRGVVPVSVNVSRADIYNPELSEILTGLVEKYGLEPSMLHLEITETAYTEDSGQLIQAVAQLKELGFLIEMDDFGTGYSSLNMLSSLPISVLKLDMKFIQSEASGGGRESILGFVIDLAERLRLPVVAEGVETEEQARGLRDMGCGYAQGYYYAKPMPKADFQRQLP